MPDAIVNLGATNDPRSTPDFLAPEPTSRSWDVVGAALGLALVIVVGITTAGDRTVLAAALALVPASAAATTDVVTHRLPSRWLAATATTAALAGLAVGGVAQTPVAVTGSLVAATPLLIVHLAAPASLGFGDVKFAAALGLVLGAVATDPTAVTRLALASIAIACAAAIVVSALLRRRRLAFGPFLVVGFAVALCRADSLGGISLP